MLTIKFDNARLENGELILCPTSLKDAYKLVHGVKPGKVYVCEIKRHREKRSKDANKYCWKLCELIAAKIGSDKDEVYRQSVREVGVFDQLSLPASNVGRFEARWKDHGKAWFVERVDYDGENILIRAYYGSSVYDAKEMSCLLDNLIQDCQALGIETLPPDEVARLKSLWEANSE